jgi:hypothetical protein
MEVSQMKHSPQTQIAVILAMAGVLLTAFVVCLSRLQSPALPADSDGIIELAVDSIALVAVTGDSVKDVRVPMIARRLNGRRVRINGTMCLTYEEAGLTQFTFIPETKARRTVVFNEKLPLHSVVPVSVVDGITEDYQVNPFTIEGILQIHLQQEDGVAKAIYRLVDARIVRKNIRLSGNPAWVLFGC